MNEILSNDVNQINEYVLDKIYIQLENELNELKNVFDDIVSNNTVYLYILGHTISFQQKIDPILKEYPEIQRVYIEPTGEGAKLAQYYAYPELDDNLPQKPLWIKKWIDRPISLVGVWDGPYQTPTNDMVLTNPKITVCYDKSN
ncbi:MAG: hypothetical protein KAX49_05005 [Halanaerobiales bacterium]|nr:hypothetical protein [Halanaerobiales bacterium]